MPAAYSPPPQAAFAGALGTPMVKRGRLVLLGGGKLGLLVI